MLGMISVYNSDEHTIIEGSGIPEFLTRLVEGDPKRRGRLFLIRFNDYSPLLLRRKQVKRLRKAIVISTINFKTRIRRKQRDRNELQ